MSADLEKQQIATNNNVANNGQFPVGATPSGVPFTLGASAAQQQYYQGGITTLRKLANPAPL